MGRRRLVLVMAFAILAWTALAADQARNAEAQAVGCRFVLGFAQLREMIGTEKVGACLEDERFNLENGNAEQRTSGGLMVWRKVDNFTAFTDGGTTWINGPNGLQSRPNAERFSWERGPVSPAAGAGSPSSTSQTPTPAPAPSPTRASSPVAATLTQTQTPGPSTAAGSGRAAPVAPTVCPDTHRIKGNKSSSGELIYHAPGGQFYERTEAEACFDTPAAAQAAGYRASRR